MFIVNNNNVIFKIHQSIYLNKHKISSDALYFQSCVNLDEVIENVECLLDISREHFDNKFIQKDIYQNREYMLRCKLKFLNDINALTSDKLVNHMFYINFDINNVLECNNIFNEHVSHIADIHEYINNSEMTGQH